MFMNKEVLQLLEDMVDSNPCDFDHHGHCQEHGWTNTDDRLCPQIRIKNLLEKERGK
jgi:hypothetical protein